jgi:hypothetical protein
MAREVDQRAAAFMAAWTDSIFCLEPGPHDLQKILF